MVESHQVFEHVWRKLVDPVLKGVDQRKGNIISRCGGRPRKNVVETIKKGLRGE
jgi:hypothetical protein